MALQPRTLNRLIGLAQFLQDELSLIRANPPSAHPAARSSDPSILYPGPTRPWTGGGDSADRWRFIKPLGRFQTFTNAAKPALAPLNIQRKNSLRRSAESGRIRKIIDSVAVLPFRKLSSGGIIRIGRAEIGTLLRILRVDYMKALSIAAVLAALTLGGCCLSFSGCEAPLATARSDWDGLVPPRAADAPSSAPTEKTSGRAKSQGEQSKTAYPAPPRAVLGKTTTRGYRWTMLD
jgi:hypothetical protein